MRQNKPFFSVIIPVYNVKDYLERCLDSVLAQGFDSYEILVVDDGSTDESGKICDAYAEKTGMTVFHKPNGGLSDARNYGLERACGEYVLFLDSDDFIETDAFTRLFEELQMRQVDMLIAPIVPTKPSRSLKRFEKVVTDRFEMHRVYTGKEYLTGCLSGSALRVEVGRHLYRRDFLTKNRLSFQKGILHEDEEFTPRALLCAESVVLTDFAFYYYDNSRAGSIMNSSSLAGKKAYDRIHIYDTLAELFRTVKPRKLRRLLEDDICWKYIDCYVTYRLDRHPDFKPKRLAIFRYAYHAKRRVKALLFALDPKLFAQKFGK